jgi:hypothetical protein
MCCLFLSLNKIRNSILNADIFIKRCVTTAFVLFLPLFSTNCLGEEKGDENSVKSSPKERNSNIFEAILLYLPNRVFDLLDIVRLKARVGPGFDVGFQITQPIRLYAGGHSAVYFGLPGPRQDRILPNPFGAELKAGGAFSVFEKIVSDNSGSDHSFSEIGVELQLLLVGVDVSIDPVEIADFFTGFVMYEIREDDL